MQPDTIHLIPLDQIDAEALSRDRVYADAPAMQELLNSILAHGLRMPVEVFEFSQPAGHATYALISGFRRLAVFRELSATMGLTKFAEVPAIIRHPESIAAACTAMVEENAIRAEISPYERGRVAVLAVERGIFATVDEAIQTLYRSISSQKRSRIRVMASVVEEFDDVLTAPEALSSNQGVRIAAAMRAGFAEIMHDALRGQTEKGAASDWASLLPYLIEAERELSGTGSAGRETRPGRPRRSLRLVNGLVIRREATRKGYSLHFSGPTATSDMMDDILGELDRLFAPGESSLERQEKQDRLRAEERLAARRRR